MCQIDGLPVMVENKHLGMVAAMRYDHEAEQTFYFVNFFDGITPGGWYDIDYCRPATGQELGQMLGQAPEESQKQGPKLLVPKMR
jgi:hypothetical protein